MSILVGLLTFLLLVSCGVLVLLILVQLPKKDAGAGLAFGGGAADALFGAGSGNALTKITKWVTGAFIVLAIFLGMLETRLSHSNASEFMQGVQEHQQMQAQPQMAPQTTPQPTAPQATTPSSQPLAIPSSATNAAPATSGK